jgi:hypothetical protein
MSSCCAGLVTTMALFVMPMKAAERLSTLRRVPHDVSVPYIDDIARLLYRNLGCSCQCNLHADMQAQLQVVTWGDSQQRPRVLLHSDTSPGALFNFETALKV